MADPLNPQPLLDAAQNQLSLTFDASDSLDTKALAILGFDLALAIFVLQSEIHSPWWLLGPLFAAFLLAGFYTTRVILPNDRNEYIGAIIDINKHPEYLSLTEQQLVLQLLADTQQAIELNGQKNDYKSRLCQRAIVCSLIGAAFLIGCIILGYE